MIDIKFLRENPEAVKQNIKNKFQDEKLPLVDEVIELDKLNRAYILEGDELRASRNKLSKQIGALMGQGKRDAPTGIREFPAARRSARLQERMPPQYLCARNDREDGLEGDRVNALYIGMLENRIFLSTCGIIQFLCIFASEWNKMLDL